MLLARVARIASGALSGGSATGQRIRELLRMEWCWRARRPRSWTHRFVACLVPLAHPRIDIAVHPLRAPVAPLPHPCSPRGRPTHTSCHAGVHGVADPRRSGATPTRMRWQCRARPTAHHRRSRATSSRVTCHIAAGHHAHQHRWTATRAKGHARLRSTLVPSSHAHVSGVCVQRHTLYPAMHTDGDEPAKSSDLALALSVQTHLPRRRTSWGRGARSCRRCAPPPRARSPSSSCRRRMGA